MDRLTAIAIFVRVAETGSFAAAAEHLSISRNTASNHVSNLEAHLGVRLLNRNARSLSLTEAGRAYLDSCQQALNLIAEADRVAASRVAPPTGKLRVQVPIAFGAAHVVPYMAGYLQRYGDIALDLVLDDRPIDLVEEGFDVAVRIGPLSGGSLRARRLGTTQVLVCGSPAYLDARGRPQRPEELSEHRIVSDSHAPPWRFEGRDGAVTAQPAVRMWSNDGKSLVQAAVDGVGLVMQPRTLLHRQIDAGLLEVVLHDYPLPSLDIHAVYPTGRRLTEKVRSFIDFLLECYGPRAPWEPVLALKAG